MANSILGIFCALLVTVGVINGQPVTKEEAASLLPDLPKTHDETVAAIVQDEVVQQAVGSVVGNGSLSGLVVKKNTVILPVDEPNVVLSHQEAILTAPLSELENIRKNITETATVLTDNENSDVTAVDEISLAEIVPLIGKDISEVGITPSLISVPEILDNESLAPNQKLTKTVALIGIVEDQIPDDKAEGDSNGKTAAIDSSESKAADAPLQFTGESSEESSEESSSSSSSSSSDEEDNFSNENPGESSKETLEFGARIPVAVVTSEKSDLRPAVELKTRSAAEVDSGIEGDVTGHEKIILAIFTNGDEGLYERNDDNDMTAAEDIIFRPLFRYRQQQNERTRILENRAYQKLGYRRKNGSQRRRPFYSADGYSDYNNYNYQRPQRTRYYDNY